VRTISVNGVSFDIIHRMTIDEESKKRLMGLFEVDSPGSLVDFIDLRFNVQNGNEELLSFLVDNAIEYKSEWDAPNLYRDNNFGARRVIDIHIGEEGFRMDCDDIGPATGMVSTTGGYEQAASMVSVRLLKKALGVSEDFELMKAVVEKYANSPGALLQFRSFLDEHGIKWCGYWRSLDEEKACREQRSGSYLSGFSLHAL
jgi:hypothetical protein